MPFMPCFRPHFYGHLLIYRASSSLIINLSLASRSRSLSFGLHNDSQRFQMTNNLNWLTLDPLDSFPPVFLNFWGLTSVRFFLWNTLRSDLIHQSFGCPQRGRAFLEGQPCGTAPCSSLGWLATWWKKYVSICFKLMSCWLHVDFPLISLWFPLSSLEPCVVKPAAPDGRLWRSPSPSWPTNASRWPISKSLPTKPKEIHVPHISVYMLQRFHCSHL